MRYGEREFLPLRVTPRQFSTGQEETHDMHPVHSGVHTEAFRCTVISTGQAFVHALQSMQTDSSRTTRWGDIQLTTPRSAP